MSAGGDTGRVRRAGRRRRIRAGALALLAVAVGAVASPAAAIAGARSPRPSLGAIEAQLMCVTCKIPLVEAQSPQAARERALIVQLIDRGESEAQIKRTMLDEYGPAVFALPVSHGFDLVVYVVPPVAVLLAAAVIVLAVRRWRRAGARGASPPLAEPAPLSARDAARLERDLARHPD